MKIRRRFRRVTAAVADGCAVMARSTFRTIVSAIRLARLASGMLSGYLVAVIIWTTFVGLPSERVSQVRQVGPVDHQLAAPRHLSPHVQSSEQEAVVMARDRRNVTRKKKVKKNVQPKILCWVVTSPSSVIRAQLVKRTWGKRCDKLVFMSSANDSSLPAVGLPLDGPESRLQLWNKAKLTFKYVHANYLKEYDWFFKADDDTFAMVENMRLMLRSLDSSRPYFLGRRFNGFLSGGCGYLMTANTIRLLVEQGFNNERCRQVADKLSGDQDDLILSVCLDKLGAVFGDTRDADGRQRFIPFNVEDAFSNSPFAGWVKKSDYYPYQEGYNCCSERAISFHYVKDHQLQVYDYLINRLRYTDDP